MSDGQSLLDIGQRNFRSAHEADWAELEALLKRIERRSVRSLSADEAMRLPVLYRATLSSLSIARETSLDRALIDYLEPLCTRAYLIVYGVRTSAIEGVTNFFKHEWPAAVRAIWKETLVAAALLFAGALVGYLLARSDAGWYHSIMPDAMAQGRSPTSSATELRQVIYGGADKAGGMLGIFATYLFTHNAQVSIMCFALGFAFGVPTAFLIVQNGTMMGALIAVYAQHGLAPNLIGWLMIHGTTELFAIVLAGAAGFRIGLATAFPGHVNRLAAATKAGKTAATVMIGVVIMLMFAGALEGVGRQVIQNDVARYAIGLTMLAIWLSYFYLSKRRTEYGR
jgi:uncharacterized membrane protein SpoIIM required for sporulation